MTWAMFLLAILVSTLGRIFGEDAKTLIPRISRGLLRRAAWRMNPAFGPGFYEEWVAHLEDTPELTLKLWHAPSVYAWGSGAICRQDRVRACEARPRIQRRSKSFLRPEDHLAVDGARFLRR